MSVIAPDFEAPALVPVGDWHPSRYTPTLSGTEDFTTAGDKAIALAEKHWRSPEGPLTLDAWQRWLIRHALETYPPDWPVARLRGQLRYRQIVVSLARQNGKSVVGAIIVLYLLCLHKRGPRVVGVASVESQAKIVYDRVKYAVENSPALSRDLRATGTRGITLRDGSGIYQTLPAKEETAQGEPITGALYDELHLGNAALWDALVEGQKAHANSLLVGITTAGDADSDLLLRLYAEGEDAIAGNDERFGFFVWEGEDNELTEANVIRANPSIACGRIPLDTTMQAARKRWKAPKDKSGVTGKDRVIRYTLNRFVEGSANAVIPLATWRRHRGDWPDVPEGTPVYAIERTGEWDYATITETRKGDRVSHTRVIAQLVAPEHDVLLEVCRRLAGRGACAFVVNARNLKALGQALRDDGFEVWMLGASEMDTCTTAVPAMVKRGAVTHAGDTIVSLQLPHAKARASGDAVRLSRTLSIADIDAVEATFLGLFLAEIRQDSSEVPTF